MSTHRDGMSVTQRDSRSQFERRRPSMSESDDSVQAEFMQVGRLELCVRSKQAKVSSVSPITGPRRWQGPHLQHNLDPSMTNLLPWSFHVFPTILVTEPCLDQLLAVLDEQVPHSLLAYRGDLDEFGKAVPDLGSSRAVYQLGGTYTGRSCRGLTCPTGRVFRKEKSRKVC